MDYCDAKRASTKRSLRLIANFFYSKGLKVSTSFLLLFLIASLNRKNANIANGILISIAIILNGLLFMDINWLELDIFPFQAGEFI